MPQLSCYVVSRRNDNHFDYAYFKKRFQNCIIKEGFVYELENEKAFQEITKEICPHPSVDFDFTVEGRKVCFEDVFLCHRFDMFKDDAKKNLEQIQAKAVQFTFDCNPWNFIGMKGRVIGEDGHFVPSYQIRSGIKDKAEHVAFLKKNGEECEDYTIDDVCCDDFEFFMGLDEIKIIADWLEFYEEPEQCLSSDIADDFGER